MIVYGWSLVSCQTIVFLLQLAKDAGNHISMTDDEKARLNELLSDLDEITDSESFHVVCVSICFCHSAIFVPVSTKNSLSP